MSQQSLCQDVLEMGGSTQGQEAQQEETLKEGGREKPQEARLEKPNGGDEQKRTVLGMQLEVEAWKKEALTDMSCHPLSQGPP